MTTRAKRRSPDQIKPGDKFGRWEVTGAYERRGSNNDAFFPCACQCGVRKSIRLRELGPSASCGCLQRDRATEVHTKHGGHKDRLNGIWRGVWARCSNPNDTSYRWYGARGIKVSAEWWEYEPFRDWCLSHGYADDLVLDRADNDGDYEPSNCRWVTVAQNNRNNRRNHWLEARGERKVVADWAKDSRCQVGKRTFETRIRNGWALEDAMTQPLHARPYGRGRSSDA